MNTLAFAPLLTAKSAALRRLPHRLAARTAARRRARAKVLIPLACLVAAVAFTGDLSADMTPAAIVARHPRVKAVLPPEAVAAGDLVRGWRAAGDERTVFERLGGVVEHAGGVAAWSAERAGEGRWLIVYRDAPGWPAYAFEADLNEGRVTPTPEAAEALTLIRVRDEADARLRLLARR